MRVILVRLAAPSPRPLLAISKLLSVTNLRNLNLPSKTKQVRVLKFQNESKNTFDMLASNKSKAIYTIEWTTG